ncbi:hypothetical protein MMC19_000005 [Ptychographa xylographoides]|nr:hypothetical protein [Ptychographa xylographoides]
MKSSTAFALFLAATGGPHLAFAQWDGGWSHTTLKTSTVAATTASSVEATTTAPATSAAAGGSGAMTITVTNAYGTALSLSYASNAGSPTPLGNPGPAVLAAGAETAIVYPSGAAGRISVGKFNTPDGSKIEMSINPDPDIDVSYVDGYTVPITCSSDGVAVTGCNYELFNMGTCDGTLENGGTTCQNPEQNVPNGPASAFFAPCAGAAYTYPNDNDANVYDVASTITCCIGTSCPAPARQKATKKRDAAESSVERDAAMEVNARGAGAPSLLPRANMRSFGFGRRQIHQS